MPKRSRMLRVKLRGKWRDVRQTEGNMRALDALINSGQLALGDIRVD